MDAHSPLTDEELRAAYGAPAFHDGPWFDEYGEP